MAEEVPLDEAVDDHESEDLSAVGGWDLLGDAEGVLEECGALASSALGLDGGLDLAEAAEESVGGDESVDAHVSAAVVVIADEIGDGAFGLFDGVELCDFPELTAEGAETW